MSEALKYGDRLVGSCPRCATTEELAYLCLLKCPEHVVWVSILFNRGGRRQQCP